MAASVPVEVTCYACEKAPENPFINFRGPASCVSCDARALALVYGGMPPDIVTPVLYKTWTDTKRFSEGRRLFWNWCKLIQVAKEKE